MSSLFTTLRIQINSLFIVVAVVAGAGAAPPIKVSRQSDLVLVMVLDGAQRNHIYGRSGARKPFMQQLMREGVAFNNLSVYPTSTKPNFASIVTGSYPAKHGFNGTDMFFDNNGNSVSYGREHVATTSIFQQLERNRMQGVFLSQKGYEMNAVGKTRQSLLFDGKALLKKDVRVVYDLRYQASMPDELFTTGFPYGWGEDMLMAQTPEEKAYANVIRMTQVMVQEGLAAIGKRRDKERVGFILVNFAAADYIGHIFGPKHRFYDQALVEMQDGVEHFTQAIHKMFPAKRITHIVTSDHGFTNPGRKRFHLKEDWNAGRVTHLDKVLGDIEYTLTECGGSCIALFVHQEKDQATVLDLLLKERRRSKWLHKIYTYLDTDRADGRLQDMGVYFPGRTPQFYLDLKRDWVFAPSFGHGTMAAENRDIPLILSGAGIEKVGKVLPETTTNVDIAPTALKLLGIDVPDVWDGRAIDSALTAPAAVTTPEA